MTDHKEIEKLLSDLHCGSGQWKNIQQIVRVAFQSCFSKVKEQEKRFEALSNEMSNINGKLNERYLKRRRVKPDKHYSISTVFVPVTDYNCIQMKKYRLKKDELQQYLRFHLRTGDYHQKVTNDLASQLHELKRNINLRSTPSSSSSSNGGTQELTDRVIQLEKRFKTDASNISSSASEMCVQRVNKSIEELQLKYDRLSQLTVDMKDEIRATTAVPALQGLRNKVDEIYGLLGDYYSKEQLKVLLDAKVRNTLLTLIFKQYFKKILF